MVHLYHRGYSIVVLPASHQQVDLDDYAAEELHYRPDDQSENTIHDSPEAAEAAQPGATAQAQERHSTASEAIVHRRRSSYVQRDVYDASCAADPLQGHQKWQGVWQVPEQDRFLEQWRLRGPSTPT